MANRTLSSTCLTLAALAALASTAARAQSPSISPFMPPPGAATSAPTPGATIEFRGVMEDASGMKFRIYDPAKKTGTWVKLNERDTTLDVLVKQFNNSTPDAETLTVEFQGRTLTLAQRTSKVVSSGSASAQNMPPPPMAQQNPNVPAAVTNAVVVNPTPADEARRLDAVAQEVARRRALREQAANGGQPAAQVPSPQQMQQQQPQAQAQRPQAPNGQQRPQRP